MVAGQVFHEETEKVRTDANRCVTGAKGKIIS